VSTTTDTVHNAGVAYEDEQPGVDDSTPDGAVDPPSDTPFSADSVAPIDELSSVGAGNQAPNAAGDGLQAMVVAGTDTARASGVDVSPATPTPAEQDVDRDQACPPLAAPDGDVAALNAPEPSGALRLGPEDRLPDPSNISDRRARRCASGR